MPAAADHEVVVQRDPDCLRRLAHGARHLDIGFRRRHITGRMIVDHDDRRGAELERALHHFARIDRRVVDGSVLLLLVGDERVLRIEKEQFRILFLDKKNQLIADEVQQTGTVDHTPVYPREVVKRALELSATAIILVHNHPSGDPTPSGADVQMTKQIVDIAKPLGIAIHDHIIVGKNGHATLKGLRLI